MPRRVLCELSLKSKPEVMCTAKRSYNTKNKTAITIEENRLNCTPHVAFHELSLFFTLNNTVLKNKHVLKKPPELKFRLY